MSTDPVTPSGPSGASNPSNAITALVPGILLSTGCAGPSRGPWAATAIGEPAS
jgi:hypothetical protein